MGLRVVVFGGTGLLGSETAHRLKQCGHVPVVVSRHGSPSLQDIHTPNPPRLEHFEHHVLDVWSASDKQLADVLTGCDGLVYAVGPDDRTPFPKPAREYLRRDLVEASERVMRVAREVGVRRAVLLGSYFATIQRTTGAPGFADRHPYVAARLEQAERCITAGRVPAAPADTWYGANDREHGLDMMILEIPYVFGAVPGQEPMWRSVLFERLRKMPVIVFPPGGTTVTTSTQVAEAAVAILLNDEHGGRYPIGECDWDWPTLLRHIADAMELRAPFSRRPRAIVTGPRWLMSIATAIVGRLSTPRGMDSGLDHSHLASDVLSRHFYVDHASTRERFGIGHTDVPAAIRTTVVAAYPPPSG